MLILPMPRLANSLSSRSAAARVFLDCSGSHDMGSPRVFVSVVVCFVHPGFQIGQQLRCGRRSSAQNFQTRINQVIHRADGGVGFFIALANKPRVDLPDFGGQLPQLLELVASSGPIRDQRLAKLTHGFAQPPL